MENSKLGPKPSKREIMVAKIIKSSYIHELRRIMDEGLVDNYNTGRALDYLIKERSVSMIIELKNMHLLTPNGFVKGIIQILDKSNIFEITEKQRRIKEERLREYISNK